MTRVSSGSWAAIAADSPCGSASTTTSYPASAAESLGRTSRSAKGSRWGCSSPRRRPALELACTPARRRFGCPASSRHTSPPAYPVAPVTPTVHVCPVLTMYEHTRSCMTVHPGIHEPPRSSSRRGLTTPGTAARGTDESRLRRRAPGEDQVLGAVALPQPDRGQGRGVHLDEPFPGRGVAAVAVLPAQPGEQCPKSRGSREHLDEQRGAQRPHQVEAGREQGVFLALDVHLDHVHACQQRPDRDRAYLRPL